MGNVDAEIFDLENIGNTQNEIVIPIFDTDEAARIWSNETEDWVLNIYYSIKARIHC